MRGRGCLRGSAVVGLSPLIPAGAVAVSPWWCCLAWVLPGLCRGAVACLAFPACFGRFWTPYKLFPVARGKLCQYAIKPALRGCETLKCNIGVFVRMHAGSASINPRARFIRGSLFLFYSLYLLFIYSFIYSFFASFFLVSFLFSFSFFLFFSFSL